MGHEDDTPRKGFDHWVSFAGQGTYFDPTFNINGKRKAFKGYNADLLTDQAISWLKEVGPASKKGKPFFLQVGYKAVHYPFQPPPRHAKRYEGKKIDYPETMANTEENYLSQSHWIRERRYGILGIDHMETGALDKDPVPKFDELSVKGLYYKLLSLPGMVEYFPDKYPKGRQCDRDYLFNVANTLHSGVVQEMFDHALKQRYDPKMGDN